ncbi:hypothetical protein ACFWA0_38875, partial [Streptomyces xanthophaeus]
MSTHPVTPVPTPSDRPGASRGALALGLLFLGGAALLALVVRPDVVNPPFQGLDDRWLRWMGGPHEGPYAALATALN